MNELPKIRFLRIKLFFGFIVTAFVSLFRPEEGMQIIHDYQEMSRQREKKAAIDSLTMLTQKATPESADAEAA